MDFSQIFQPSLPRDMRTYNMQKFRQDIIAGMNVGIISLPLAIALAVASGASPEQGLLTACIIASICAVLSGSSIQITGPTGALTIVVFNIIAQFSFSEMLIVMFLSGLFQVIMGIFRCGTLLKFIPFPITLAFSTGVATSIFSSQIGSFFGLTIEEVPAQIIPKWQTYISHFHTIDIDSTIVALSTTVLLFVLPKISKKIPAIPVALLIPIIIVYAFNLSVSSVYSVFGELSSSIPSFAIPDLSNIPKYVTSAITLAILSTIASLLSAAVADGFTGKRHNPNTELIAQGIGNMIGSCFACIPATGVVDRTTINARNNAQTQVSSFVYALMMLASVLFLMPFIAYIPMASLAGILVGACYNMVNWKALGKMLLHPRSDFAIFISVYILTIVFDLMTGIQFGLILTMVLFIRRMCLVTEIKLYTTVNDDDCELFEIPDHLAGKLSVIALKGPLFFAVTNEFNDIFKKLNHHYDAVVVDFTASPSVDASALRCIDDFIVHCTECEIEVFVTGLWEQPTRAFEKAGIMNHIPPRHHFSSVTDAIEHYEEHHKPNGTN